MSHGEIIQKNYDVLLRCTTINYYVIDFLKGENVLDRVQEAELKETKNPVKQRILMFQWLQEFPLEKYESFLQVMNDTEQEHVTNLLRGRTEEGQLPLLNTRHDRLEKIRHKIAHVICTDSELIAELRSFKAISVIDVHEIRTEKVEYVKSSKLISAIMRRSNQCYNRFQDALRKTLQTVAAEFLNEGEMPVVHLNNKRPDMDENLSFTFNEAILNNSGNDTRIQELITEMNEYGLTPVKAIPGQSILIFIYCKTVQNAVKFTQLFNSGILQYILDSIFYRLLLTIEPRNRPTKELNSLISLEDEEIAILEEFTGIEGWKTQRLGRLTFFGKKSERDATTQTDDNVGPTETEITGSLDDCVALKRKFEVSQKENDTLKKLLEPQTPAGCCQIDMENTVSKFLVSTCRMNGKFTINSWSNFHLLPLAITQLNGPNFAQTVCGSQAEFYIQPINPCIDDLDILCTIDNIIASDSSGGEILEGVGDLCDMITRTKLEAYEENPSFIRLRDPICGTYDWNSEEYKFINISVTSFLQRNLSPASIKGKMDKTTAISYINGKLTGLNETLPDLFVPTGPAMKNVFPMLLGTRDLVPSVRCPNWPLAAGEWLKRRRCSGWPSSATISKVVREGCDVVPITHRDMHEELNQWRLSFSRAEVILIQSWTPTQQLVYHLLRFFAKRELIRKKCPKTEEVMCTYHLKTLVLWSCEEESAEWWEMSSVVSICCKLLGKLCECLRRKHCPNYFIPASNLLGHELKNKILHQTIKIVHEYNEVVKMSQWFAAHYVLPAYQKLCNEDETILTEETIERCRTSVCDLNKKRQLNDLNKTIFLCADKSFLALKLSYNMQWVGSHLLTVAGIEEPLEWFIDVTAISKIHNTLADYVKALILFQVSQFMLYSNLQGDVEFLYDIWKHIIRQSHFVEISYSVMSLSVLDKSMLYFNRAEQILKHLAFSYSENESYFAKMVSMLYLQKSLSSQDTSSSKTESSSRLYLAALFCHIGYSQCAVQLCSQVATSFKKNDQFLEVRTLKVSSLLFMDDVATIAGFLLLRRKILGIPSKGILFLSPDLFVHYLIIQCNPEELETKDVLEESLIFEADYCLASIMRYHNLRRFDRKFKKLLIQSRCTEDIEGSATHNIVLPGSTDIAETLIRISNDYMTRFYASLSEEFGTRFNLAPCYEALSLYLCRRYEDVIHLCEKLLEESDHDPDSDLEDFQYLNINVSLFFIPYFDEDIQALVGFQLLVLRLSLVKHDVFENMLNDSFKWMRGFQVYDGYKQSMLAYRTYCNTYKPILRRKFLRHYLKLRCLLDLGFPLFEVQSAFLCLESRFLFEHTLLHFMRRKIARYHPN